MKFMKLGSKPDAFQTDGDNNTRYVATELAADFVVFVGDVKFYLHKFPLLSKSARLQKLLATTRDDTHDQITIREIPGGPNAFEICAKYCYGMTVTLNAYNVVAARCAAEYLEMYETVDKGNLIYKIDVFLSSSIFRSWKDSIIVLQTSKSLLPLSEELKVVAHCIDSIASKASIETSKVEWSYTYNRKKNPSESETGVRKHPAVPKDWWAEDLCDLPIDLYKRVITAVRSKGRLSSDVIGEALMAFASRRLQGCNKNVVETLIWLLPTEKGSVSCGFLMKLLHAIVSLECGESLRKDLMKRVSQQLDEATVSDLLIPAPSGNETVYDVDVVRNLLEDFIRQGSSKEEIEFDEIRSSPTLMSECSKTKVARVIDGYLAEISRDSNLPMAKFMDLAQLVSSFPRQSHDGLYRAIDMFLKEHPGISKSERKRICRLMDCKKLSAEACTHAVQNERLPLRVVVQVLFFEQSRSASSSGGCSTPDLLPSSVRGTLVPARSHGSSRSATTNTDEDWDALPTAEELKALKGKLAALRLRDGGSSSEKVVAGANRTRGVLMNRKIFSKIWSGKDRDSENSSSETSGSPSSSNAEVDDTKSRRR